MIAQEYEEKEIHRLGGLDWKMVVEASLDLSVEDETILYAHLLSLPTSREALHTFYDTLIGKGVSATKLLATINMQISDSSELNQHRDDIFFQTKDNLDSENDIPCFRMILDKSEGVFCIRYRSQSFPKGVAILKDHKKSGLEAKQGEQILSALSIGHYFTSISPENMIFGRRPRKAARTPMNLHGGPAISYDPEDDEMNSDYASACQAKGPKRKISDESDLGGAANQTVSSSEQTHKSA